jgi:hypothetical protein
VNSRGHWERRCLIELQLLSLGIIGLGIWLATRHGDCEKPLTIIVFVIGIIFLIVSILGLVGASFAMVPILYTVSILTRFHCVHYYSKSQEIRVY